MTIEIREVVSKKELRNFIYFPRAIHSKRPYWLPPLYSDEWAFYNSKKNPSLKKYPYILALAYLNNVIVGRIMGIVNHQHNKIWNKNDGRFFALETIDDIAVTKALIGYIEKWLKEKGLDHIVGPYGFSDKEPQGLLTEGFDELPVIATATNDKYLVDHIVSIGFEPYIRFVNYRVLIPESTPAFYERISERILNSGNVRLKEFTSKNELKPFAIPIFKLVNITYEGLFGFVPMTDADIDKVIKQYFPIVDPRFVKLILAENELVAFVIGIPHLSEGLKKADGKLFPFGFIHILSAMKKATQLDLFLGAIHPKYRGRGLDVLMGKSLMESSRKAGIKSIDSHLELETNTKMRAEMERMGGKINRRYTIFRKKIE